MKKARLSCRSVANNDEFDEVVVSVSHFASKNVTKRVLRGDATCSSEGVSNFSPFFLADPNKHTRTQKEKKVKGDSLKCFAVTVQVTEFQ